MSDVNFSHDDFWCSYKPLAEKAYQEIKLLRAERDRLREALILTLKQTEEYLKDGLGCEGSENGIWDETIKAVEMAHEALTSVPEEKG